MSGRGRWCSISSAASVKSSIASCGKRAPAERSSTTRSSISISSICHSGEWGRAESARLAAAFPAAACRGSKLPRRKRQQATALQITGLRSCQQVASRDCTSRRSDRLPRHELRDLVLAIDEDFPSRKIRSELADLDRVKRVHRRLHGTDRADDDATLPDEALRLDE